MSPIILGPSSPATTPDIGRKTFGQMKEDVCIEFGMDQDPDKLLLAGRKIQSVIDSLNMKKLWQFNLIESADITSTPGTADYAVPADLWRLYNVRKTSDVDYSITPARQRTFDILFQSQRAITGFPYVHIDFNIYRNGTLRLFPIPDAGYTFKLRYFALVAKPTSDEQTIDMPPPYQIVPEYGAKAMMAALVGNATTVSYWEGKYQEAYKDMNDSDEDPGDEDLRFVNIEEMVARSTALINPSVRPRFLDFYALIPALLGLSLYGASLCSSMLTWI